MIELDKRVPFALLGVNIQGEESRELLRMRLVEIGLFTSQFPQTETQIAVAIARTMQLPAPYPPEATRVGVDRAIAHGTVESAGSAYCLTEKGLAEVTAAERSMALEAKSFTAYFRTALPEFAGGYTDALVEAFRVDLQGYLNAKADELTYRIDEEFDKNLAADMPYKAFVALDKALSENCRAPLDQQKIRVALRDSLAALPATVSTYILSLYRRAFYHKLLMLDPGFQKLQRNMLSKWSFYLDTNLILSLLIPTRLRHKAARQAVLGCANAGCRLYVTECTMDEIHNLVESARRRYPRFRYAASEGNAPSIDEDVFIADFVGRHFAMAISDFDAYLSQFEPLEPRLEDEFCIEILTNACEAVDRTTPAYVELESEIFLLKDSEERHVPKATVVHDSVCLSLVDSIAASRERNGDLANRVWFLTQDYSLGEAECALGRKPRSMLLEQLLSLMTVITIPYWSLSEGEYVQCLLSSALATLAPDSASIVHRFVNRARTAGLNLGELPPENVSRMLQTLENQREAFALVETYRRCTTSDEKQAAFERLYEMAQEQAEREPRETESYLKQIDTLTTQLAERDREQSILAAQIEALKSELPSHGTSKVPENGPRTKAKLVVYVIIGVAGMMLGIALGAALRLF